MKVGLYMLRMQKYPTKAVSHNLFYYFPVKNNVDIANATKTIISRINFGEEVSDV